MRNNKWNKSLKIHRQNCKQRKSTNALDMRQNLQTRSSNRREKKRKTNK